VEGIGARPACVLPYEDWFPDPARNLARLAAELSLSRPPSDPLLLRAAAEIVDAGLRHDAADGAERTHPVTRELATLLRAQVDRAELAPELRRMAAIFIGFEQLVTPLQQAAGKVPELQRRLAALEAAELARRAG
jgi:hypothetical protein